MIGYRTDPAKRSPDGGTKKQYSIPMLADAHIISPTLLNATPDSPRASRPGFKKRVLGREARTYAILEENRQLGREARTYAILEEIASLGAKRGRMRFSKRIASLGAKRGRMRFSKRIASLGAKRQAWTCCAACHSRADWEKNESLRERLPLCDEPRDASQAPDLCDARFLEELAGLAPCGGRRGRLRFFRRQAGAFQDDDNLKRQREVFEYQLDLARRFDLPISCTFEKRWTLSSSIHRRSNAFLR
jgi:hypothetical protein